MSNTPVRLYKKETAEEKLDSWANANAHILLPLALITLLVLSIMLCFAICGLSATDSGVTYNHLQDVI